MISDAPTANALWSALAIEELTRLGVDLFCISPGSRSTPLTLAAAAHPQVQTRIFHDERSAAFFAIGYARATGKPAVLICTSGTALANYFPAVIEASADCIPMLILSADRPPELRETGANQTIRQAGIFGEEVRWFFDLPCPTTEIPAEFVLTTIDQAHYRAMQSPAGPVHLNWMFREPLVPTLPAKASDLSQPRMQNWLAGKRAFTTWPSPSLMISGSTLKKLSLELRGKQGLLVVGQLQTDAAQQAVRRLAEHLDWPIFAEITSGLRSGKRQEQLLAMHDLLLRAPEATKKLQPQIVLQIGSRLTSKRLLTFLRDVSCEAYILLTNHPLRHDPDHRVHVRLQADIVDACDLLIRNLQLRPSKKTRLLQLNSRIEKGLSGYFKQQHQISEPAIAQRIGKLAPANSQLFLASSMPVRDMDTFALPGGPALRVFANRGASGIDGTISSAMGCAFGGQSATTLLIGDIAFLHDLNALQQLSSLPEKLVIVLINNNGGGIFSFLPVVQQRDHFERYFATPHGLTFQAAAELFGVHYACPANLAEFEEAYRKAWQQVGSTLIEVRTDREQNLKLHKEITTLALQSIS